MIIERFSVLWAILDNLFYVTLKELVVTNYVVKEEMLQPCDISQLCVSSTIMRYLT